MIELNSSKLSITANTAFRKDLPYRGALLVPYTHVNTAGSKQSLTTRLFPDLQESLGGAPD